MIQLNKLSIKAIGKIKKPWIYDGINQYKKRMPDLVINELKNSNLINLKDLRREKIIISLSEEGKLFNSEEFATLIESFKGLPNNLRSKSDLLLSLSPLTFTHEFARLILIEQIYRAFCISQNYPYHRS